MKKNTILVDFDVPDDWEYKRGIEDVTGTVEMYHTPASKF